MAEIPILVDTNIWGDLGSLLRKLNERTGKSFREIWNTFEADLTTDEKKSFKGTTNFMKRLLEMKESSSKYVIHVPNFVYNEAARSLSSKISSQAKGNDAFEPNFKAILDSLPISYDLKDKKILQEGVDYPNKVKTKAGNILETTMKDFLKENNQPSLIKLIEHLKNPSDEKKKAVQERTQQIKKRMKDVSVKYKEWDKPMVEASKIHNIPYETKTNALSTLYGSIEKYRDTKQIPFKAGPIEVLTERLLIKDEEFDFFDLQNFLYAKENKIPIITKNTQTYQEVNDPYFLGYFEDVKIIHPSINFDSLEDLNKSGDLNDIIDRSINNDFNKADLNVCRELDSKLNEPIIERKGGELIRATESGYSPGNKPLKINMSLGSVLKLLRFENRKLKVSKQYFFEEYKLVKILQFVDKEFFEDRLNSNDFVKDTTSIQKTRDYFLKSSLLADYLENNPDIKEKLDELKAGSGSFLDRFLEKSRGKQDQEVRKLFLALTIESHFSETEIEEGLKERPSLEPLPLHSCPSSGSVRKRETRCLLSWNDIEKFNDEKFQKRDPLKVKIDSQKFLDYLKTIPDSTERKQLIDFADQILNSVEDHTSKISGPKVEEVTHLINNRKVLSHFSKVHYMSSALNCGFFAKCLLGDLLKGNIEGVAVNIGFMAGNFGLAKLASVSLAKGVKLADAGKLMLGNSLKYASPFISRFLSPLIALDLYNQIKALEAGDKDAIVGIVGDSVFLIVDAVDIGISLLEIAGVITEISAVTGPIGMAIGALVIVGGDIYFAVRKVLKLDQIIHLTTGERWEIGAVSFFTFGLVKFDVERLAEIKAANNQLAQQALEIIKKSPDIQRIVIPSAERKGDGSIGIAQSNTFSPYASTSNIKWQRVRPDDPSGGRIFCAPEGDWENPYDKIKARCGNAIGITDTARKTKNYTLLSLGDGEDLVKGYRDSPNIFRIGKGKKVYQGGNDNDIFILEQGTSFNDFPKGIIDGMGGSNILNFGGITSENNEAVILMFFEEPLAAVMWQLVSLERGEFRQKDLYFLGIDSVIGRENESDVIHTNCSTKYVDARGGPPNDADYIFIKHTFKECNHDKIIHLGHNTLVLNEAVTGKFSYFVKDVFTNIKCVLKRSAPYKTLVTENNRIEHNFFLNGKFSDILKFEFNHEKDDYYRVNIQIYFMDKNYKIGRFYLDTILGYGKDNGGMDNLAIYFQDNVEMRYHHNGIYALLKSNESVEKIIRSYRIVAISLDISIFIYAEKEGAMVSIGSDKKDDVLYNDPSYKSQLVGNLGNNTYMIISGKDFLQGPDTPTIPEIYIYSSDGENHFNLIDLHSLSQQIKTDLNKELLMRHYIDSQKLVLYLYTAEQQTPVTNPYNFVTSITFRNIPPPSKLDSWCKRQRILLNNAPVTLKCDRNYQNRFGKTINYNRDVKNYNPSNYYIPLPLVFSGYDIIIITKEDVEPNNEVIVKHKLGQYRFLRLEEDLILTNGFDFKIPNYKPTTLIIKHFYKDPAVFYTLKYRFEDKTISFKSEKINIERAKKLEEWYNEYDKISTNILGTTRRSRRDLGGEEDTFINTEIKQSSGRNILGTIAQSLSNIYQASSDYIKDYVNHLLTPAYKPVFERLQNPKFDFPYKNRTLNESISGSNANFNENQITFTDVNSTLLLLDTFVRKLNDFNYSIPLEDNMLMPHEHLEKKMAALTSKLGLDPNDIEGSLEINQQRILDNIADE